jgi:polyisoprenoid-binding protein YceI
MKKKILTLFTLVAVTVAFVSCKNKAKEATIKDAETVIEEALSTEKYAVDAATSTIEWKGFKPAGNHNGTINLENGIINTSNGNITSGSFLIAMGSIIVKDIPAEDKNNAKLLGHLKTPDFFDVENHPNAAFEITGIEGLDGKTMLSGNLAIKGVKNNITFPVTVVDEDDSFSITSETFTIDRTKWDIKFKSKNFFENLGGKFINDEIELKINVKANKL